MSVRALHTLVGKAVVSEVFRSGILNGKRATLIRDFNLDLDEQAAIMAIRSETLAEFAAAVEQIVDSREACPIKVLSP